MFKSGCIMEPERGVIRAKAVLCIQPEPAPAMEAILPLSLHFYPLPSLASDPTDLNPKCLEGHMEGLAPWACPVTQRNKKDLILSNAILVALFIFAILLILYVILWYICRDVDCDHGI
ncbi:putative Helicase With Zinc Finger Domain [Manis pentadactyla]|nr:putative Helicase With Zinc Finger Domain [Manis pentadactyla]